MGENVAQKAEALKVLPVHLDYLGLPRPLSFPDL
jgi:hypothetical protein